MNFVQQLLFSAVSLDCVTFSLTFVCLWIYVDVCLFNLVVPFFSVSWDVAKCICPNYQMYLFKIETVFVQNAKQLQLKTCFLVLYSSCSSQCLFNWVVPFFSASSDLWTLQIVFFQIAKCIFSNFQLYLLKLQKRYFDWKLGFV